MSVELAYSVLGDRDKPMLVMSSALGTSRSMWAAQHPLAAHHSLLLYDHRGLGASPAPLFGGAAKATPKNITSLRAGRRPDVSVSFVGLALLQ